MPKRRRSAATDPVATGSAPPPSRRGGPSIPKGWSRPEQVLDVVEAVGTIFPDFNAATRVGGLPVRRVHTVTGPTSGGKSVFCLGLLRSFLDGGHFAALVDAEHTTPRDFAEQVLGSRLESFPRLFADRPKTYEATITAVDSFLEHVAAARESEPGLASICVVDSINKLTPARELAGILKGGGAELAKGHHGRYRAALNQGWLDHVVPRLAAANCSFVLVAQERDEEDDQWNPALIREVKIKGGRALSFDASMIIRVSKALPLRDPPTKEGEVVGFAHRVRIHKSKVGTLDGNWSDCVFHVGNGKRGVVGHDLARDCLLVGRRTGLVKASGSWLSWNRRRWQGESRAAAWLAAHPESLAELAGQISGGRVAV